LLETAIDRAHLAGTRQSPINRCEHADRWHGFGFCRLASAPIVGVRASYGAESRNTIGKRRALNRAEPKTNAQSGS
jgi:hypothetical protein